MTILNNFDSSVVIVGDSLQSGTLSPNKNVEYNPFLAVSGSLLVPGLGQAYTRHILQGSLFLSAEVIMGLVAGDRYRGFRLYEERAQTVEDSLSGFIDSLKWSSDKIVTYDFDSLEQDTSYQKRVQDEFGEDSIAFSEFMRITNERALADYEKKKARVGVYNTLIWAAGCYLFNAADAFNKTGIISDSDSRKPMIAGWLSAIPFLGLGQVYNGAFSKAGMICMVESSLALVALNYHSLVKASEREFKRVVTVPEILVDQRLKKDWEDKRNDAFRSRNTYLWYLLLFYGYGIFDAVVDAHLHDFSKRMNLKPDLDAFSGRLEIIWRIGL